MSCRSTLLLWRRHSMERCLMAFQTIVNWEIFWPWRKRMMHSQQMEQTWRMMQSLHTWWQAHLEQEILEWSAVVPDPACEEAELSGALWRPGPDPSSNQVRKTTPIMKQVKQIAASFLKLAPDYTSITASQVFVSQLTVRFMVVKASEWFTVDDEHTK